MHASYYFGDKYAIQFRSFVPAEFAKLRITDKILTLFVHDVCYQYRKYKLLIVCAIQGDSEITTSSFMSEMQEELNILKSVGFITFPHFAQSLHDLVNHC